MKKNLFIGHADFFEEESFTYFINTISIILLHPTESYLVSVTIVTMVSKANKTPSRENCLSDHFLK